jgi:hypothetical protein
MLATFLIVYAAWHACANNSVCPSRKTRGVGSHGVICWLVIFVLSVFLNDCQDRA